MGIKYIILLIIFGLFLLSCTTTEPPDKEDPPDPVVIPSLALTEDDTHCVESWLKLSADSLELPAELVLWQYNPTGDSVSMFINIAANDTLLHIDSLLPDKEYSFIAAFPEPDSLHPSSNIVTVTTMDTTSHDFTFDMLTFGGEYGSCALYDCAIIDENNIWAVGEITIGDSVGSGYSTYNAVHWDGNEWRLKRIPYYYGSSIIYGGIYAIEAFSENDIWFGLGNLIHWDGVEYTPVSNGPGFNSLINAMWGTGSDNLYIVGNEGNIARYNGAEWIALASGTTLNINDIWGDYNEKTGQWEILAVASNILQSYDKEVLIIQNNSVQKINKNGIEWTLSSVWFECERKYYVVGSGIYQKKELTDNIWDDNSEDIITEYHVDKIRANELNDLFVAGAFGEFLHFNGSSWKSYQNIIGQLYGSYYSIDIKNDLIVAVGYESSKALLLAGLR